MLATEVHRWLISDCNGRVADDCEKLICLFLRIERQAAWYVNIDGAVNSTKGISISMT